MSDTPVRTPVSLSLLANLLTNRAGALSAGLLHDGATVTELPDGWVVTSTFEIGQHAMPDGATLRAEHSSGVYVLATVETLELAALQGLPWELFMLSPMAWSGRGKGDTTWREHVGNMVPPPTAAAIASVMAHCLLLARAGVRFTLSAEPVWVQRIALSMAIGRTDEQAVA